MYITYDEYKALGGIVEESDFLLMERLAEKKLDYWTPNAFHPLDVSDDVMLSMTIIINGLQKMQGDKVSSFSNDGISVSFIDESETLLIYQQILEIMPSHDTYLGVKH